MASRYEIQELRNGLRIRASRDLAMWERLFITALAGVIAGFVGAGILGIWWIAASPVVAAAVFIAVRARKAVLRVTNVEFITTGDLGRRAQTPRVVNTAEIRRLEFKGEGGAFLQKLEGLYAMTDRRDLCVLPFLNWEQTQQVIHAIERKFPGLAEGWR